ncbi:hypothetical protein FJR38_14185 [Anabaena sp. UHCC 0253]|nr:hypothetical protein [Anabaena sp. UHCC 0253]
MRTEETFRFFPRSSAFLLSVVSCQLLVVSCQLSVVNNQLPITNHQSPITNPSATLRASHQSPITNLLLFAKVADLFQQLYLKFNHPSFDWSGLSNVRNRWIYRHSGSDRYFTSWTRKIRI